jgi:hypothetical protein
MVLIPHSTGETDLIPQPQPLKMSYRSEIPTPEAEIDKELHSHTEDVKHTLPIGDGYIQDPSKGKVETVRNVRYSEIDR